MDQTDKYYHILGLEPGAGINDIKRAYRICARRYHPDLNKSASATRLFIETTEAYQFLLAHYERQDRIINSDFLKEWEDYKKAEARRTASAHARKRYNNFVNSDLYRSTRILDKSRYYIGVIFAVLIIVMAIYGYVYRLKMVDMGFEKPTLSGFMFLMSIGLLFLITSLLFLLNHRKKYKK